MTTIEKNEGTTVNSTTQSINDSDVVNNPNNNVTSRIIDEINTSVQVLDTLHEEDSPKNHEQRMLEGFPHHTISSSETRINSTIIQQETISATTRGPNRVVLSSTSIASSTRSPPSFTVRRSSRRKALSSPTLLSSFTDPLSAISEGTAGANEHFNNVTSSFNRNTSSKLSSTHLSSSSQATSNSNSTNDADMNAVNNNDIIKSKFLSVVEMIRQKKASAYQTSTSFHEVPSSASTTSNSQHGGMTVKVSDSFVLPGEVRRIDGFNSRHQQQQQQQQQHRQQSYRAASSTGGTSFGGITGNSGTSTRLAFSSTSIPVTDCSLGSNVLNSTLENRKINIATTQGDLIDDSADRPISANDTKSNAESYQRNQQNERTISESGVLNALRSSTNTSSNRSMHSCSSSSNRSKSTMTRNVVVDHRQYRLVQNYKKVKAKTMLLRMLGLGHAGNIGEFRNSSYSPVRFFGVPMDQIIVHFLHLAFRRSFMALFIFAVFSYWVLTLLFGTVIYILAMRNPHCISGVTFDQNGDGFADAFALSWVTFSTLGYGVVYVAPSSEVTDIRECTALTIVVTLEAFMGMIYGSLVCAILFVKVGRIQSIAQVAFSNPIVIRYGPGVRDPTNDNTVDDEEEPSESKAEDLDSLPCPVLEFRIANRMHNVMDGEIMDCSVNIVASVDSSQLCKPIKADRKHRRKKKGPRLPTFPSGNMDPSAIQALSASSLQGSVHRRGTLRHETPIQNNDDIDDYDKDSILEDGFHDNKASIGSSDAYTSGSRAVQKIDLLTSSKRVFSKLVVGPSEHPLFNRVWTIRHVLNLESPLLRRRARDMLKANSGFWPKELNNYEGVRNSFHFDSFLVSFSGTSNADCNSVYAQHIYDFAEVNIGYTFVNMLYRDEKNDDCLCVALNKLNDIIIEPGRGGESIQRVRTRKHIMENRAITKAKAYSNKVSQMLAL